MNAVEIEEAISELAEKPFDPVEFPFDFLRAFGNKETTIKKLRKGTANKSDLGGVLQTNNIHIVVCAEGKVSETLNQIKESPVTIKAKAKFALATDGVLFEAEALLSEERVACEYNQFADHFGFFLALAGISTVKEVRDNSFDIKATSRLNRLYVQLLQDNPDWAAGDRRDDMNHFMARLIFCFFAEDTSIFPGDDLFTDTVAQMSERDAGNTHEVISEIFRAMDKRPAHREAARVKRWADQFPYVNGELFAGSTECPEFSRIAKTYLLNAGKLDWTKINPDIFGSMIQAVADDDERGELGMHYTSVPNILKVLNALFLDDLREALDEAGDNARKLLNLRKRIARIRVFDPACGSGNFLVIAYKQLREIENQINERRAERGRKSDIPLTNFRGIEIRGFSAEIARLALIIAEYQCDVAYLGQKEALMEFLPLSSENWITCGNALRLDWLTVCPPTGTGVTHQAEDLFEETEERFEVDFENEGGETYICGNPPFAGLSNQSDENKAELKALFEPVSKYYKSFDYVMGWLWKASQYVRRHKADAAFVSTNSVCQGQLVPMFWPLVLNDGVFLSFAHKSFKWKNLAAANAGVTVAILGISSRKRGQRRIYFTGEDGRDSVLSVRAISPYLIPGEPTYVKAISHPLDKRGLMIYGNKASDGGGLTPSNDEARAISDKESSASRYIRDYIGSEEFIHAKPRKCIWISDDEVDVAMKISVIKERVEITRDFRSKSKAKSTRDYAQYAYRFRQIQGEPGNRSIVIPRVSSEARPYLPVGLANEGGIISDAAFAIYDAPLWNLSLLASKLHLIWVATVCGKLETRYRYSNTLGWNAFPVPKLTEKNEEDLTRCAENILLAREAHFPATIADLYSPETMPENLRAAHEENDETLERVYIGRRFKNDTERLEKLFDMYTKMTGASAA